MFWAGVVGVIGALSSILFRIAMSAVRKVLTGQDAEFVVIASSLPWWMRLAVPTVGGLSAGLVLVLGHRVLERSRSTDYMEAVVLGDGMVRARPTMVKSLSALLSIASGASLGREGPMVQLAAMLGSLTARVRGFPLPRRRLLVACGAAAGIASAYNAPISGALFVAEVVFGSIAMESLGPLIVSSVVASLTLRYAINAETVFEVHGFRLASPGELGAYVLLGFVAGAVAPWFLRALRKAEELFQKLPVPLWLRLGIGGAVVGVISIRFPSVWGNGYAVVNSLLHETWTWSMVAMVFVAKLAATSATVGSGAVGGVFTPTLFMGAAIGQLLAIPLHRLLPDATGAPQYYALVGMGCFLTATTHAPLMAILMVFEMTLDWAIIIPLTLGCVAAYFTARSIESESIYSRSLARKKGEKQEAPLETVHASDLMNSEPPRVLMSATFREVAEHFARGQHDNLFVVDATGRFRGAVPMRAMEAWLNDPDLQGWAIASDLLKDDFPAVTARTPLSELVERFSLHRANRIAVVDQETGALVGSVAKADVLLALAHGSGGQNGGAAGSQFRSPLVASRLGVTRKAHLIPGPHTHR